MLYLFIYFEKERERQQAHTREAGGERERIPSRLLAVSVEPDMGLDPMNCEIMT